MKILSLQPEQVWAIMWLGKRVENRTWQPTRDVVRNGGFTLALHSAKKKYLRPHAVERIFERAVQDGWVITHGIGKDRFFCRGRDRVKFNPDELPRGEIVALTNVNRVVRDSKSVWAHQHPDYFHWELGNVHRLVKPVPCRGRSTLFVFPAGIREQILEQLG